MLCLASDQLVSTCEAPSELPRAAGVALQPFQEAHRAGVIQLLEGLPGLYPGADLWLPRRLSDVTRKRAFSNVAIDRTGRVIGITIETPKLGRGWKLSTIYVAPNYRGQRIGHALAQACLDRWLSWRITENVVTVRLERAPQLLHLLAPLGFRKIDEQRDRYGAGQTEVILKRSADSRCNVGC